MYAKWYLESACRNLGSVREGSRLVLLDQTNALSSPCLFQPPTTGRGLSHHTKLIVRVWPRSSCRNLFSKPPTIQFTSLVHLSFCKQNATPLLSSDGSSSAAARLSGHRHDRKELSSGHTGHVYTDSMSESTPTHFPFVHHMFGRRLGPMYHHSNVIWYFHHPGC